MTKIDYDRCVQNFSEAVGETADWQYDPIDVGYAGMFYHLKLAECAEWGDWNEFSTERVAAAVAAFSPGFSPENDIVALNWIRDNYPTAGNKPAKLSIPYNYKYFELAYDILHNLTDPVGHLKRDVKRGEYWRAILGDPDAFVIDVHCWRTLIGADHGANVPLRALTVNQYRAIRLHILAAGFTSVDQAKVWYVRRLHTTKRKKAN